MAGVRDIPRTTRHDPAADERLGIPFSAGAAQVGRMKGSQSQYDRVSINASVGSSAAQPALQGQFAHPIPPPKGDRQ